jgi:molybdopterin synthase catalytic subunit
MPGRVVVAEVVESVLDVAAHIAAVDEAAAGATVSFSGVVRDHDGGRGVTALEYSIHPTAARVVAEVAAEIAARPGVGAVAVSHRYGVLVVGDVALAAAVSAAHRAEAFLACGDLVDEVKKRIPIWKRQVFTDGTDEWVGSA